MPNANHPAALDEPIRICLCSGTDDKIGDSIRARLFGQLVRRTVGVVVAYESDLFHDAGWIARHVDGPTSFYWGVRDYGTHIGADLLDHKASLGDADIYKVDLTREGLCHTWFVTLTLVAAAKPASVKLATASDLTARSAA